MRRAHAAPVPARLLYLSVAVIVLTTAASCARNEDSAEAQIRSWISSGVEAAEAKARRDLVAMISPAYGDSRGNGRDDIENMLRAYFLRAKTVALVTNVDEVRIVADGYAEVSLTVGMVGRTDSVLGFNADAYRFELELGREGDDWRLISARWAEVGREPR